MKPKILLFTFSLIFSCQAYAQVMNIEANPGTSATPALGTSNYVANESIYTDVELGGNFTTSAVPITSIGLKVNNVGTNNTFNNVAVYFKDVPATTTTFTTGPFSLSGYTQVFNGSITLATAGFTEFLLAAPYVRTSGTNLQVLILRTDGVGHAGYIYNCANGNQTGASLTTTRRYNGTAAPVAGTTSLTQSQFRQAMRFAYRAANDGEVKIIYTLGKLPLAANPSPVISALLVNQGTGTLTNLKVALTITGANNFTDTQTISSLSPSTNQTINFTTPTFTNLGINNIKVSIPADDIISNDSIIIDQIVNSNTWSYSYGNVPSGGVGFNAGTGDFVAKFNTNINTQISQISVNFTNANLPFKIGIWDDDGAGGLPGTLLWESNAQVSAVGLYVLPVLPAVSVTQGNFYVGVRQTGTSNIGFAFQSEDPIRGQTFYFTSPTGTTNWTDFAPGSPFRFMIEPKLILPVDASFSDLNFANGNNVNCTSPASTSLVAVIANTGINTIAANAASVTLKVSGANSFMGTLTNPSAIASGSSGQVVFNNVPNAAGVNLDTAYVVLSGDLESANDTLKNALTVINTFSSPVNESFHLTPLVFGTVNQMSGTGQWALQSGTINGLAPYSAPTFAIFNAFSFTTGTSSRLESDCINVPAVGTGGCGNPVLTFKMSHSSSFSTSPDSVYVSISTNAGATWNRIAGYARYDATFSTPGWMVHNLDLTAYANSNVRIGFEGVSYFGDVVGIDDVFIGSGGAGKLALATPATNAIPLVIACEDGPWTYYAAASNLNQHLLGINWDPSNNNANASAKAVAAPQVTLNASLYASENTATQQATYTMRRYWNVNTTTPLVAPVHLRFFYDSVEVAEVNTAASTFVTAFGGSLKTPTWFKTKTGAFSPTPVLVTPSGISNSANLTNSINGQKLNNLDYAEFQNISSFSGGTFATGVGTNPLLPIELVRFTGIKQGVTHLLEWAVTASSNLTEFILERSADGQQYQPIARISATQGVVNKEVAYKHTSRNVLSGNNYYRLQMKEPSGYVKYSSVVVLAGDNRPWVSIYPNPATDKFFVELNDKQAGEVTLTLTDQTGKVISSNRYEAGSLAQSITFSLSGLSAGQYILKVQSEDKIQMEKVTVR